MFSRNTAVTVLPGALLMLALSACSSSSYKAYVHQHTLLDGATLTLKQPIVVDKFTSTLYLQDGTFQQYPQIDLFEPHCIIALDDISPVATSIEPDKFTISNFYNYVNAINWDEFAYESLADLSSNSNPRVSYLSCKYHGGAEDDVMNITDIEAVLATFFTLERVAEKPGRQ